MPSRNEASASTSLPFPTTTPGSLCRLVRVDDLRGGTAAADAEEEGEGAVAAAGAASSALANAEDVGVGAPTPPALSLEAPFLTQQRGDAKTAAAPVFDAAIRRKAVSRGADQPVPQSRVVVSNPALFWTVAQPALATTPADALHYGASAVERPTTLAHGAAPSVSMHNPPGHHAAANGTGVIPSWHAVDCAFFRRAISGGARYGECWLRASVEAYGAQLAASILAESDSARGTRTDESIAESGVPVEGDEPLLESTPIPIGARLSRLAAVNRPRLAAVAASTMWRDTVAVLNGFMADVDIPRLRRLAVAVSGIATPLPGTLVGVNTSMPPDTSCSVGIDSHDVWQLGTATRVGRPPLTGAAPLLADLHAALVHSQSSQAAFMCFVYAAAGGSGLHALAAGIMHADVHVRAYTVSIVRGLLRRAEACGAPAQLNCVLRGALQRHADLPATLGIAELVA